MTSKPSPFSTSKKVKKIVGLTTHFQTPIVPREEFVERSSTTDLTIRAKFSPKERAAFHADAVTGLTKKLTLNNNISDNDDVTKSPQFMDKNLRFTLILHQIKKHIEANLLDSVFKILNVDPETNVLINDDTIYLLDDYTTLDIEDVKRSVAYYREHSTRVLDAENMVWSMEFIYNSCDEDLQEFLDSKFSFMDERYHGGPTMFMLVIQEIIHNNDNIARALTQRLENLSLSDFAGENVDTLASCVHAICDRLECCNKLPHDIDKIILGILDTCTVQRFTTHFMTLYSTKSTVLNNYRSILDEACSYYRELRTGPRNTWLPTTKNGSVYSMSTTSPTNTNIPSRPPTPLPTHDNKGRLIDRNPPTGQAPHSRANGDNNIEHWCTTCVRWGHHLTEGHDEWKKKMKERRNKQRNRSTGNTDSPGVNANAVNSPSGSSTTTTSGDNSPGTSSTGSSGVIVNPPSP
jgi:hypothetical protein